MQEELEQLDLWKRLDTPEAKPLLAAIGEGEVTDVASLAALRRDWAPDMVAGAIELARARAKARSKFPNADVMMVDVEGVEQATSHHVAEHKAKRFGSVIAESGRILDLCCGIGGDAMSLARVGEVTAVDQGPSRAWMAGRNAGCLTQVANVEELSPVSELFHLDPSRRAAVVGGGRRRMWRYEDYQPGPAYIDRLLGGCPDGAIKLGPGVDFDVLPKGTKREIEIINVSGSLVQAVLWCGRLAQNAGQRTATRLPEDISFTARCGEEILATAGGFERYLLIIDPAIERAGLTASFCRSLPIREAWPGLGILTSDEEVAGPWLRSYEVLAQSPWRMKKIKDLLRALDAGIVTVKTRGKAIDPDAVQKELRGDGEAALTVFGLRLDKKRIALITRPVLR